MHEAPVSAPLVHIHPRFQSSQDSGKQLVGGSGSTKDVGCCLGFLAEPAARLSVFPDLPQPLDANSEQRRVLLDTDQHPFLLNNSTTRVHTGEHQHSALGAADKLEA